MLVSGANALANHKEEINALNVFPVPDGDTGTNMNAALFGFSSDETRVDKAAEAAALFSLRNARGNSGVIFSRILAGIASELKGKSECSAKELSSAFLKGCEFAYDAVAEPVEGTILTVMRVLAEAAASSETENLNDMLVYAIGQGEAALLNTKNQLEKLKEADVVDSGGKGLMVFFCGMEYYVRTGKITEHNGTKRTLTPKIKQKSDEDRFGYCTEFIIEKPDEKTDGSMFIAEIKKIGNSVVTAEDEDIIKVHIHTENPGIVLEKAIKIGEVVEVKIENMSRQHKALLKGAENGPKKKFGILAVSSGRGFTKLLKELGADRIIEQDSLNVPSSAEFAKAADKIKAEYVFIFPNNKNSIMAAEQAKKLADSNITVIKTKNETECISSLIEFDKEESRSGNEHSFSLAAGRIKTCAVTTAQRTTVINGIKIKTGDIIGIANDNIYCTGKKQELVLERLINDFSNADTDFVTVFTASRKNDYIRRFLSARFAQAEFDLAIRYGGQKVYDYVVSIEKN